MKIVISDFGRTATGDAISLYHIENASGAYVDITDFGARIVKIVVPNKAGELVDVNLGYNTGEDYTQDAYSLGAVCGRVANRIKEGRFTLNGVDYQLAINNGPNSLHGGLIGFDRKLWKASVKDDKLVLTMEAADGEENYPGNLTLQVTYSWSEDNEIGILYEASSDADTILNVTNHAYFNLNGEGSATILNNELFIDADSITPVDKFQIPTGEFLPVEGTPFDFRTIHTIGKFIDADYPQLADFGTYDHNFVISGTGLREAAVLQSKETGIRMTCFTDQPGLQVYVMGCDSDLPGKGGVPYVRHSAVCLETQHYPDSINHDNFPSIVLKANEAFRSKTLYHFSTF